MRGYFRRHRRTVAWVGAVVLVAATAASIVGGILALGARTDARRIAESRAAAAEALADYGSSQLDRGLLLGLEAYSISPTAEARASLVQGLEDADRVVRLLRVPSLGAVAATTISPDRPVTRLAFSSDERTLTVGTDGRAYRWDVASGRRVGKPTSGAVATSPERSGVAISPASGRLIATAGASPAMRRSLALWDTKLNASGSPELTSAALSPDGKVIAAGTLVGTVLRWDVSSRHALSPVLGGLVDPRASTTGLAFSPDGALLAVWDSAGTVSVFDLAGRTFARLAPAPHPRPQAPHCLTPQGLPRKGDPIGCEYCAEPCADAVSPGDRVSAVAVQGEQASADVVLWNVRTRRVIAHLRVDQGPTGYRSVDSIAFSPDGRILAVSAGEGNKETVTLWDVTTGVQLGQPLVGRPSYGGLLEFGRDGASLTLFAEHRTVTWRPLPLSQDIAAVRTRICDLVGRNLTRAEWQQWLPGQSYRRICPQWP